MAKKKETKPTEMKASGEEIITAQAVDNRYTAPEITPERAYRYAKQNIHLAGNLANMQPQIFPEPATVLVVDEKGDTDDKLTAWIRTQTNRVCLDASMVRSWSEAMWAGCSVKSVGLTKKGNLIELDEIRDLPAISFREPPTSMIEDVSNPLMPGIIYDKKQQEVRAYQTESNTYAQKELSNFTIIRDPTTPAPAGEAYCLPVYPVISMIDYANQAANQQVNRTGAPLIFPKFSQKMTADLAKWGKGFIKHWGKNTGYIIPDGIEFLDPKIHETSTAEDRLKLLINWISFYFNPTTVLESGEGTTIGASDSGAMSIWNNYIGGIQHWLEDAYETIIQQILDLNGYEGYRVQIRLPRPSVDRTEAIRQQALTAINGAAILPEELRTVLPDLDLPQMTPEIEAKLKEQYPEKATPVGFGNVVEDVKNYSAQEEKIFGKTDDKLSKADAEFLAEINRILS